ncbi:MAG: hypothetical protein ABIO70_19075, partial [Pseudomonadota bacterium]
MGRAASGWPRSSRASARPRRAGDQGGVEGEGGLEVGEGDGRGAEEQGELPAPGQGGPGGGAGELLVGEHIPVGGDSGAEGSLAGGDVVEARLGRGENQGVARAALDEIEVGVVAAELAA